MTTRRTLSAVRAHSPAQPRERRVLLLGAGALLAGLRPRAPLPPEPDPYRAGEQPLAARADEEITLRVRDDSPPE